MQITWLGHSCFRIVENDYTIILDPYAPGSVPGLLPLNESAHLVLCSHEHADHHGTDSIHMLPADRENPFSISRIPTWHDEVKGKKRGKNDILILHKSDKTVVHLGDLGTTLTPEELNLVRGCDVLMIPVGGYFTIDAETAARLVKEIAPAVTIPMHYHSEKFGYDVLSSVDDFTALLPDCETLNASTLDPDIVRKPGTYVLSPLYL